MVKKCCVPECRSGYSTHHYVTEFSFPRESNPELRRKWILSIRRKNLTVTKNTFVCENHFEEKFIYRTPTGQKRLRWNLDPVPSIFTYPPSVRATSRSQTRRNPRKRVVMSDELKDFQKVDQINSISDLSEIKISGWIFESFDTYARFYQLSDGVPEVFGAIVIDSSLHVKLSFKGRRLPYPPWIRCLPNCVLTKKSQVAELFNYVKNCGEEGENFAFLEELASARYSQGSVPYSTEIIRFALRLRYTSLSAYEFTAKYLPLPSLRTLRRISSGSVDSWKLVSSLTHSENTSKDMCLLLDEMYLQPEARYDGVSVVGVSEENELYTSVVCFMLVSLKNPNPVVIRAMPVTKLSGKLLLIGVQDCLKCANEMGINIRAISTDNHSVNVNLFGLLTSEYPSVSSDVSSDSLSFRSPFNGSTIFLIFDPVHLIKNIRNNWLKIRRFRVPPFEAQVDAFSICFTENSFIDWDILKKVFDKETGFLLKKAPSLSFQALHPFNKKQNVPLAIAVFDIRNAAAIESYFPEDKVALATATFIRLIYMWWNILNAKSIDNPLRLANGIRKNDGKILFLQKFARWVTSWDAFSKQTQKALVQSSQAVALLSEALLDEQYDFVLTSRFQTDYIEKRFSCYRQMSGGRFLVSLYDVKKSEKIVQVLKILQNVDSLNDVLEREETVVTDDFVDKLSNNYSLSDHETEVVSFIAGYVSFRLQKKSCTACNELLKYDLIDFCQYITTLDRGGLSIPSKSLFHSVCDVMSILIENRDILLSKGSCCANFRHFVVTVLLRKAVFEPFSCDKHCEKNERMLTQCCTNIIFNNIQKEFKDSVRKVQVEKFKKQQRFQ